jgi:lycopene beta-cyclase
MIKSVHNNNRFDYIIAGAGCAGLSLLVRILQQETTKDKRILLVDRSHSSMLNKTWCFWEKEPDIFESIVHQQYDQLWYHGNGYSQISNIHPYRYKMIRGEDFYHHCMGIIEQFPNVQIITGEVTAMSGAGDEARITIDGKEYSATYVFNSILFTPPKPRPHQPYLLQHFKGWFIQTERAVFDPGAATLMDFRVPQEHGASFVYVMPLSPDRALVEYTVFSEQLLGNDEYEENIRRYIEEQIRCRYSITGKEEGVIPMTSMRFPETDGRIIYTGTAGGQTKPSSGYTFQFIQQQSAQLASQLGRGEKPVPSGFQHTRFHFYDAVLLQVLARKQVPGEIIFTRLFSRNRLSRVLQFLANQSSLSREMRLISVLPKWPFLKAALYQLFR